MTNLSLPDLKYRLKQTWLHPRYLSNRAIRQAIAQLAPQAQGTLFDIGCGRKPYQALFAPYITRYIGMDRPSSMHGLQDLDFGGTTLALPVADDSVDTVLATEVMEHIAEPELMLAEIFRVLHSGGFVILSVPFHEPLHELPFDFFRYTDVMLTRLFEEQGFHVQEIKRRGGTILVLCHLFCSFIYRKLGSTGYPREMRPRMILGPLIIAICCVTQMICSVLDPIMRDEYDTLGFVVLARKPS